MRFSVVITTFNRAALLPRALDSVLRQTGVDLEVVVVDDGSTDDTAELLRSFDDPRVHVLHRTNGGLGAARNTGIDAVTGDWTTFLDDDDHALSGWLERFGQLVRPDTGVVFCGAEFATPSGDLVAVATPKPLGPVFGDHCGLLLAGTWSVRTDLLREAGGYDPRLACSHQTELLLRVLQVASRSGLGTRARVEPGVRIERRPPQDRPLASPSALYEGVALFLDKHGERMRSDPRMLADYRTVMGVSAARLERWSAARRALTAAALSLPANPKAWARLGLACLPAAGRRVWNPTAGRTTT